MSNIGWYLNKRMPVKMRMFMGDCRRNAHTIVYGNSYLYRFHRVMMKMHNGIISAYFYVRNFFKPSSVDGEIREIAELSTKEVFAGISKDEEDRLSCLRKKNRFWLVGNDPILEVILFSVEWMKFPSF